MTQGLLFVITAPSGAGKSSLIAKLLEDERGLALSVSYTTRAPRPSAVTDACWFQTFARAIASNSGNSTRR